MSALPRGQKLMPLKQLYASKESEDKFKNFYIVDYKYGTQGYVYTIKVYHREKCKWGFWHRKYNHMELFKYFRLPTPAEEVLFGVKV